MAVLPMKRVSILGLHRDRKAVLETLQRLQVVEVIDSASGDNEGSGPAGFFNADTSQDRAAFEKNASYAASALEVLDTCCPEKTSILDSLNGRKTLSVEEYEKRVKDCGSIMNKATGLMDLAKTLAETKAEIPRIDAQIEALIPWESMDVGLNFSGTSKTRAFVGSFAEPLDEETILSRLGEMEPTLEGVDISIISVSNDQTCIMAMCLKQDADKLEDALRRMSFARPPASAAVPSQQLNELRRQLDSAIKRTESLKEDIASRAGIREDLKFAVDYFTMRADKYRTLGGLSRTRRVFLLEGYVPEKDAAMLEQQLCDNRDLIVEFSDPGENEDVPVIMSNNSFATPVESIVENYSMPGRGELDPSFAVACFYYFLFGLMLSDAAYGLIILIATHVALTKFKNMEEGTRRALEMFRFCGLGTIIAGVLFGSYFGDMIPVVAKTFFGAPADFTVPAVFDPLNNTMPVLDFAFAVGIIQIFTGLGLLIYTDIKQGKVMDAIYDGVFWYLLVGGLIIFGLTTEMLQNMLQLKLPIPPAVGSAAAAAAAVGAVGIILTGGRESRNWFKRILKGLYAVYNVTGYLSDILSYSRLLALGLATSVISSVFNQLGSMGGKSVPGVLLFIIIALLGHSLNIAINALGAYVHSNRLTFVEFFGKFYEGGGRKFTPFAMNTKYYKVKED